LEKRGQGRFVEFARELFNFFTAYLFSKGEFSAVFNLSLEKRGWGDFCCHEQKIMRSLFKPGELGAI
jgi:hypothetical protein